MNAQTALKQTLLDHEVPPATDFESMRALIDRLQQASDIATATSDAALALMPGADAANTTARAAPQPRRSRSKRMSNVATATQVAPATPQPSSNTLTLAGMLVIADDLGKQAAMGVDVQIKFDLKVLEASFHGSIDLDVNKHGNEIDDATKLSEAYWRGRNGAAVFDVKAGNQRKLISTTRKAIKLGMWPKGGPGEPLQTVNNLITIRQKIRRDPANAKRLDDAHNTFMRFATAQLKRDQVIGDAELPEFCYKPDKDEATIEDVIESTRKRFQKLRDGKLNHGLLDNSAPVLEIIRQCTKRLSEIAKAKGVQAGTATPSKASTTTAPATVSP